MTPRSEVPQAPASVPSCCDCPCGQTVASVVTASFEVSECEYRPAGLIPRHRHDRAGFCLVLEGGFDEQIEATLLRCGPAMLLFHPAGATHANVISDEGSRCLNVEIAPAVMSSLGGGAEVSRRFHSGHHGVAHWFAYKLRTELRGCDELTPLVIDGVALALLGEFARLPGSRVGREPPAWLERTRSHLHDEFVHPPALSVLAEEAGVHRVHLARAFRQHYACTVGEYVRQRRIEAACHRLVTSDSPLTDVALSAGFSDQSHFSSTFKRMVGLPPGVFRVRSRTGRR